MSVDKGYVFGRSPSRSSESHSPEIDVLIHNTLLFRPVFRLEDFVIVQPESVLAVVQVKRTLKGGQLENAVQNVVSAKNHVVNLLGMRAPNTSFAVRPWLYSAVIGFDDHDIGEQRLQRCLNKVRNPYEGSASSSDRSFYILPDFIGSLQGKFFLSSRSMTQRQYRRYPSQLDGRNYCIQAMIASLTETIWHDLRMQPPFAFDPQYERPLSTLQIEG
jgi:hypothetical protein